MLKVCDRTLIRWRNSGKLPFFKLSGKIYFWASDVYKFLREECLNEDFISDSINS
jgi:predicted site-specific integrase-resolvase